MTTRAITGAQGGMPRDRSAEANGRRHRSRAALAGLVPAIQQHVDRSLPSRSETDAQVKLRRLGDLFAEVGAILGEIAAIQLDDPRERHLMDDVEARPTTPKLMSVRGFAERLDVDPRTIRRWREEGKLPPAVEVGGIIRWRPEDVDVWLEEQAK